MGLCVNQGEGAIPGRAEDESPQQVAAFSPCPCDHLSAVTSNWELSQPIHPETE